MTRSDDDDRGYRAELEDLLQELERPPIEVPTCVSEASHLVIAACKGVLNGHGDHFVYEVRWHMHNMMEQVHDMSMEAAAVGDRESEQRWKEWPREKALGGGRILFSLD